MKTIDKLCLLATLAGGLSLGAAEPPVNAPGQPQPAAPVATNAPVAMEAPPGPFPAPANDAAAGGAVTNGVEGLRLNFRGAPLETVLNYLSDAAGFIIVLDAPVRGTVDVWSGQPVTKDEAVNLLNSVLNKNGYAAIRNDRVLTIVSRDAAKTRDIPVKRENDPDKIPKNDEIVTQIVPVRYINATQVTKDLQPLLPMTAQMSANEAGNALVITDTQASIRRMAEIVKALDTSLSSVSAVKVFMLKFADAKTVATVIKDLFQDQGNSQRNANDLRAQFFQRFRGGGPPGFGGDPGGGGGGGQSSGGSGRVPAPKVVATSDDRSNSLIVSAPDDMMPTIEELVRAVDTPVDDITEVRVFRLKHADPIEMADLLMGLFPDDTRNTDNNRSSVRFGGGMFGGGPFGGGFGGRGGNRGGANATLQSERQQKMGRVLAVADQRTASVVVSAAKDLMEQIAQMVVQLDEDPAKKQKVFVFSLENADVQEVEQILRNMFDKNGTMNNRNTQNQNSRLNTRSTQNQTTTGSTIGNSGMGNNRGVGGTGGLGGGGF